jgi:drug/metabolite transporter (DMT)-like permease
VITRGAIERDLVIIACGISAGIHAALTPDHLEERTAAGVGFAVSAVLLACLAVALTRRASPAAIAGSGVVFAGLLASYALAVTTGVPLLHPHPEPVEGLALFTKAVELAGLLGATHLLVRHGAAGPDSLPRLKGTLG